MGSIARSRSTARSCKAPRSSVKRHRVVDVDKKHQAASRKARHLGILSKKINIQRSSKQQNSTARIQQARANASEISNGIEKRKYEAWRKYERNIENGGVAVNNRQ